ncbi:MAG: potassium channel beta subunit family protein [Opitutales bacterium]
MEYRRMGHSGLQLSALSFGSWVTFGSQVDDNTAQACMTAAYDRGCNFFDNAEAYAGGRSEIVMGNILNRVGWPRDTFVVSSKVFFGAERKGPNQQGLSRKHVFEACHAALRRLQVDHLDLYFCHRPDPDTPVEETVRAMTDLIRQGKVLYWGTSEWSAAQIAQACGIAREQHLEPPSVEQPQYNLFHRHRVEVEYADIYDTLGIGTTVWSPLASGLLTGKYNEGLPGDTRISVQGYEWLRERFEGEEGEKKLRVVGQLKGIADSIGTTLPRMALAWCLKNLNVSTVITGASRPEQVEENFKAVEDVPLLDAGVMAKIDAALAERGVGN